MSNVYKYRGITLNYPPTRTGYDERLLTHFGFVFADGSSLTINDWFSVTKMGVDGVPVVLFQGNSLDECLHFVITNEV